MRNFKTYLEEEKIIPGTNPPATMAKVREIVWDDYMKYDKEDLIQDRMDQEDDEDSEYTWDDYMKYDKEDLIQDRMDQMDNEDLVDTYNDIMKNKK